MSTSPKISVIVPIFKMEAYLELCVDSILSQTYRNLEIILVDDQSPDNCWAMMEAYAAQDKRVKIYKKPTNGGLSDARNYGMERATGDYFAFVDADDFIEPQMYEKMMAKALADDCDIVMCSYTCFWEAGDYFMPRPDIAEAMAKLAEKSMPPHQLYWMFFNLGTTVWRGLFRADLINTHKEPFPKGLYYEDDYWHTFHRLRAKRIGGVNEPLYRYRSRDDSISGGKNYSTHIIEIFKRFEAANAEYLKNEELSDNYDMYKIGALRWHLPSIVSKYDTKVAINSLREIKKLVQNVKRCHEGNKEMLKMLRKQPVEKIYFNIRFWWIKNFFSKISNFFLRVRFNRKQNVAYIQILGLKFDFQNSSAPKIYLSHEFKKNFILLMKSIFRICVIPKRKIAYVQILGIKIGASKGIPDAQNFPKEIQNV